MNSATLGAWRGRRAISVAGALVGLLAGLLFTRGIADANSPRSTLMVERAGETAAPIDPPEYPVNADGQTFGVAQDVASTHEPDLIRVVAENGREGYVDRHVLDELTGGNVSSPAEALEWEATRAERALLGDVLLPVYLSDGRTQIGEFRVSRTGGSVVIDAEG